MNDEEQRSETELRNMPRENRPAHSLYNKCTKCGEGFKAGDRVWITVEDDPVCDGCGNKIPPPPIEHKSIGELLSSNVNNLIDEALLKFQEGGFNDIWLEECFAIKTNLHYLLARVVNLEKRAYLDEGYKARADSWRKHLTFASRANASKRRHLRRLMIRYHIEQAARSQGYGYAWVVGQMRDQGWIKMKDQTSEIILGNRIEEEKANAKAKRLSKLPAGKNRQ